MTMQRALKALGFNRQRWEVQNMALALDIGAWGNTPEENERRDAAKYVLRRWDKYRIAANIARDKANKS